MEQKEERFRKRFWIKNRQDRLTMEAEKDKLKKELVSFNTCTQGTKKCKPI
jgi:hypothetical protein